MTPTASVTPSADDASWRMRVAQSLLAVAVYAVFAIAHEIGAALQVVDTIPARALSLFTLAGSIAFYSLVRSGSLLRRFDPVAVTQAQCLFGVLCATLAYAVNGAARGGVLVIFMIIIVFGMFVLRPAEARRVGVFALAMLGAVMAWGSSADAVARPPAVEVLHFSFAAIGVVTLLVLSERMGAMRATMSAQKAQLEDVLARLQEVAIRDELTGLVNRRHGSVRFESELVRHEGGTESFAVALLDIDNFKHINDRHGHAVGDAVLRFFAKVAAEELRSTDVLARWGGEEFLLLMPLTPEPMATAALERLRTTLKSLPASIAHPDLRVSFSAGVASMQPGDTVQTLLERADCAMYSAKAGGRDRVVVAGTA